MVSVICEERRWQATIYRNDRLRQADKHAVDF